MTYKMINTEKAPKAIGPYSQGVMAGNMLFISGQLPIDPETMELVGGSIENQTKKVMENIEAILKEVGATFNDIVKTTIFLTDLGNFAEVNKAYGEYFNTNKPARACIEVSKLPKDAEIEIEAIVIK